MANPQQRWFPTEQDLKDPHQAWIAVNQILQMHYSLLDRVSQMQAATGGTGATSKSQGPPPGCGPVDTQLLGLRVAPVDVQTLPDGALLRFSKQNGNFYFK